MSKTFTDENWDEVKCTLDKNGVLIINTENKNVTIDTKPNRYQDIITPWDNYRSQVKSVIIKGHISFKEGNSLCPLFENCYNCESFNGLNNLDVSNVTYMANVFNKCSSLKSLKFSWNCEKVTAMTRIIYLCTGLVSLDLSGVKLNSTEYVDMTDLFYKSFNLTYITTPSSFDLRDKFRTKLYSNYPNLYTLDGTKVNSQSQIQTNTLYFIKPQTFKWSDSLDNSCYWFYSSDNTLTIESDGTNNKANDASELINQFTIEGRLVNPNEVKQVKIQGSIKFVKGTNLTKLFYNFCNCESFDGLNNLDVSEVVNMSYMFGMDDNTPNTKLKTLNVSNWIITNVTDMSYMFSGCSNLNTIDLSSLSLRQILLLM